MVGKPSELALSASDSVLVIVDFQQRLCEAMPADGLRDATRNVGTLVLAARTLGVPVLVTEQYPRGLGRTLAAVAEELGSFEPVEKVDFSVWAVDAFRGAVEPLGARSLILAGVESHVCVYQSARDLVAAGFAVHVVADAVLSRVEANRLAGLELCRRAGAVVTTTEVVAFDWLKRAGGEAFKAISRRIR
jgi:nicotinamidase-related amidase